MGSSVTITFHLEWMNFLYLWPYCPPMLRRCFIFSFLDRFELLIGHVIEEISVGLGPSGELRYPSQPYAGGGWRFAGIGEFQCYDEYMMEDLRIAACLEGRPHRGGNGPQDAGCYNISPLGVSFFEGSQKSF
ncbi:hypothetical protein BVRB_4g081000 [Beta vulgaris subsp. vulgaris]|nr:hypothetical protein BVRB_4g081000 [Beta vulgaris subsp. vulgaris]